MTGLVLATGLGDGRREVPSVGAGLRVIAADHTLHGEPEMPQLEAFVVPDAAEGELVSGVEVVVEHRSHGGEVEGAGPASGGTASSDRLERIAHRHEVVVRVVGGQVGGVAAQMGFAVDHVADQGDVLADVAPVEHIEHGRVLG